MELVAREHNKNLDEISLTSNLCLLDTKSVYICHKSVPTTIIQEVFMDAFLLTLNCFPNKRRPS